MYYNFHPFVFAGKMAKNLAFYLGVSFPLLLHYLFRPFRIFMYIKEHVKLQKALGPFKQYPLIKTRTSFIYLFSYISPALSAKNKIEILMCHYRFLHQLFSPARLKLFFGDGIECWNEIINNQKHSIKLVHSSYLEFEGSLSLLFNVNATCIYALSFTITPGKHFGVPDEKIIYVSRLQGKVGEMNAIAAATKNLKDLIPSTILMSVLEGIGLSLGIKKIVCINSIDQLSSNDKITAIHYSNYDAYWISQGGVLMNNGNYLFSCPLEYKPIESIKAKYRNRTIAKRAKRREIAAISFMTLSPFIKTEFCQPPLRKSRSAETAVPEKKFIFYPDNVLVSE